ncbi:MAG: hypothetical protein ACI306_04115 [Muribaculaceae bacterium]
METKKCPYCGGKIMESAKKCKHCGEWLQERHISPRQTSKIEVKPQIEVEIKHSNTKKILLIVVGGLVLAFIIWLIIVSNQKSDWEKAMDEYNSQQSSVIEEPATTYDEIPVYNEGTVCPYDGVPDVEIEDYSDSEPTRTDAYDSNSNANAWN